MKKLTLAVALMASMMSGCAGVAYMSRGVNQGFLYADSSANEKVTDNSMGSKTGQACSTSILGWVTTGDASVAAAAKAGGITRVAAVDNKHTNIVGIYATYCVVVYGD